MPEVRRAGAGARAAYGFAVATAGCWAEAGALGADMAGRGGGPEFAPGQERRPGIENMQNYVFDA